MHLAEVREDLIDEIQEQLSVVAGSYPITEVGEAFEQISASLQALGICHLLLSMDSIGFTRNLLLSGYSRRHYLRRCQNDGISLDAHLAISRNESIFDVIAVGGMGIAEEIIELSSTTWVEDGEYEDDFCYFFFLHSFLKNMEIPNDELLDSILIRFEEILDGEPSARLQICRSFQSFDQDSFFSGFEELLEERESQIENQTKIVGDDLTFIPKSHVFVEGLALLQIGQKVGFAIDREPKYCPSIAISESDNLFPHDIFTDLSRNN